MYELHVRNLGLQEYNTVFEKMREFTRQRTSVTTDELWCVQHPAVFTLGANADTQHILSETDIPITQTDRGGQVTYHGPGQIIIYMLIDLKRKSIGVKKLVEKIEKSLVALLASYKVAAQAKVEAHGVYVEDAKIASLGLRVHSGCSYHGLALNADMDISPFLLINPCGFSGLEVTQLKDHGVTESIQVVSEKLIRMLCDHLDYKSSKICFHD